MLSATYWQVQLALLLLLLSLADRLINVYHALQVDVPTLELIDLPGLQLFPDAQAQLTSQLANNYLQEPNTLVLCVFDARIPALTDSLALTMVRDAGKLPNTILALTKSDLVRGEDSVAQQIFDRILRDSEDEPDNIHLEGLAGCVAVANRNHRDHTSLIDAEAEERCIFGAMLDDVAEFYAPPEIQKHLLENMTIKQLIVQLDRLFHNFIVQNWKPAALALLAPLREEVIPS